ncbi:MAG: hypothetical protein ABFD14_13815 [Anaerolineaceae bacterium]
MKKQPISIKNLIALSAYLDGQMNEKQTVQLEAQLKKDAELRQVFTQMRQTRFLLRQVKPVRVPRNFTLKPKMIADMPQKAISSRWIPALSYATLTAAVLMVITLVIHLLPMQMKTAEVPSELTTSAPVLEAAEIPSAQDGLTNALPVIIWGDASAIVNTSTYDTSGKRVGGIGGGGGAEGSGLGGGGSVANPYISNIPSGINGIIVIIPRATECTIAVQITETLVESTTPYKVIASGPILGLRISEQVEQETASEPAPAPAEKRLDLSSWGITLGLGFITLGLGIASLALWLKKRRT